MVVMVMNEKEDYYSSLRFDKERFYMDVLLISDAGL